MSWATLDWTAVAVHGAMVMRDTSDGLAPARLPDWTLAQIPDPALTLMAGMAAGVRIALTTDARAVRLRVTETGLRLVRGDDPRRPAVFDLRVGGVLAQRRIATAGPTLAIDMLAQPPQVAFEPGTASEITFDALPPGTNHIEIWLPQSASVVLHHIAVRDATATAPGAATGRSWVHHGSSISHAMDADGPSETWPAVAAHALGLDLTSLGFAGQCLLDPFVARTIAASDAALVSLKLGINLLNHDAMRARIFGPAVHGFLDLIRDRKPDVPILVISPIICPLVEDRPGPTLPTATGFTVPDRPADLAPGALTAQAIRAQLAAIVARRRDPNLHYLDGLDLFGADDVAGLPDLLHPDAAGQRIMGARFAQSAAVRAWADDSGAARR